MDNMTALLGRLRPIEDKILELMAEKMPIVDEISALRRDMVRDCVHSYTYLTDRGVHVTCNFCSKNFTLVQHGNGA